MTRIQIDATRETSIAEDKDAARSVREELIIPALARGEQVELDFEGVELATQSYVHALISAPICEFGSDAMYRISFRNCNDELRELILAVVEYTLMAMEASGEPLPEVA